MLRSLLLSIFRWFALRLGIVILSKREHTERILQCSTAVSKLTEVNSVFSREGCSCIVFSKDRATQLYSLLESYIKFVKNPVDVFVIYNASNEAFSKAYAELIKLRIDSGFRVFYFREKGDFKSSLLDVLSKLKTQKLIFLTDDDLFIREIDFSLLTNIDPFHHIFSLRHGDSIRRSYTADKFFCPPSFRYCFDWRLLEFEWFESPCEWSDPWSVDGHLFSSAEVTAISQICDYKAPNTFEAALKSFHFLIRGRKGLCCRNSVIVNIPFNRVQDEVDNKSGLIDANFLLDQWNGGLVLDFSDVYGQIPISTHEEYEPRFKKRAKFVSSSVLNK